MSNIRVIKQDVRRQEKLRRSKSIRKRKLQRRRNILIGMCLLCILFLAVKGIADSKATKEASNIVKTEKESDNKGEKDKKGVEDKKAENDEKSNDSENDEENNINIDLAQVNPPRQRDRSEVLKQLGLLARENKAIYEIYASYEDYPDDLLALLANNPETTEFVSGYLDSDRTENSQLTKAEKKEQYPLLLQWDKRWGYNEYGDSIIGLAGCGPTCLSMVVCALTGNENVTPDEVAQYSERNGHYVNGTGTAWALMTEGADNYGLKAKEIPLLEEEMKKNLDNGKMIITAVGPGDFTLGGHFIVIYGYDKEGFLINDPNCKYRSSITWSFETLSNQIKMIWAYSAK